MMMPRESPTHQAANWPQRGTLCAVCSCRRQGVPCHVREYDESGARSNLPMRLSREVERRMAEGKSGDFQTIVRGVHYETTDPVREAFAAILDAADSQYHAMRAPAWLARRRACIAYATALDAYRIAKTGGDDVRRVSARRVLAEAKDAHAAAITEHREAVAAARAVRELKLSQARRGVYAVVVPALRWKVTAHRAARSRKYVEVAQ